MENNNSPKINKEEFLKKIEEKKINNDLKDCVN